MKNVMVMALALFVLMMVTVTVTAQAQDWKDLHLQGDSTYAGAVYAATCNVCNDYGRYNDDAGVWECTNDRQTQNPIDYDCKQAILEALAGRYNGD